MKSTLSITFLIIAIQTTLFAQLPEFEFKAIEESRSMSRGTFNAIVVSWPKASTKILDKNWKQYAKKFKGKLKYDGKQSEYFLDNAEFKEMSENMVDVTAKITQKGEGAELVVWFNLGVTYLSSNEHAERYPAAEKFLRQFDLLVYAELMKQQLKDEQKKLKLLNKELKKIEKAQEKEEKKIEKQKKTIEKAEKAIDDSQKVIDEQETKKQKQETEVKLQNQLIDKINAKIKETKGK